MAAPLAVTLVPTAADNDLELLPLGEAFEALGAHDLERVRDYVLEAVANVMLFVPLGLALALREVGLIRAACGGLALSAAIEVIQLLLVSGRTTSLDDVLFNTTGAALGHLLLTRWTPRTDAPGGPRQRSG